MDDKPLQLHLEVGARVVCAWQSGPPAGWRFRMVRIGTLAGGRWYAQCSGQRSQAVACPDESHAAELAAQWMADGQLWERTVEA